MVFKEGLSLISKFSLTHTSGGHFYSFGEGGDFICPTVVNAYFLPGANQADKMPDPLGYMYWLYISISWVRVIYNNRDSS